MKKVRKVFQNMHFLTNYDALRMYWSNNYNIKLHKYYPLNDLTYISNFILNGNDNNKNGAGLFFKELKRIESADNVSELDFYSLRNNTMFLLCLLNKKFILASSNNHTDEELKLSFLLSGLSTYDCDYSAGFKEATFTEFANEKDYHAICRYGKFSFNDIKEKYGDQLILRLSKYCFFNTKLDTISLFELSRNVESGWSGDRYLRNTDFMDKLILTKQSEQWFSKFYQELFPSIFCEDTKYPEIRDMVNFMSTLTYEDYDKESCLVGDKLSLFTELNNNLVDFICNRMLDAIQDIKVKFLKDQSFSKSEFQVIANILKTKVKKEIENQTNKYNKEYLEYLNSCERLLAMNKEENIIHTEVQKAYKFLERSINQGIIHDFYIKGNVLVIQTNALVMDYVDKNDIRKAYKSRNWTNYSFDGREKRIDLISKSFTDDNLVYVTSPIKINMIFTESSILVGFENNDCSLELCRNRHLYYGANVMYNGTFYGTQGCRGSFSSTISEAANTFQLTRLIALIIQYVKTFVPLDIAGATTLENCLIANYETGEILSSWNASYEGYNFREVFDLNRSDFCTTNGLTKVSNSKLEEDKTSDILDDIEDLLYEDLESDLEEAAILLEDDD